MKSMFLYIIVSIIMGTIVLMIKESFWMTLLFIFFSTFTIVRIFREVYFVNKYIMVNTYVDEDCQEIKNRIESGEFPDDKMWHDITYVLDESITKEDYMVARNITDNLGDIFREFMKASITLISRGCDKEQIDEQFFRIVEIIISQLAMCKSVDSDVLISHVVAQNYKNLKFCIETNQYEWFKQYVDRLNEQVFDLLKDNQGNLCDAIIPCYCKTLVKLIQQDKIEWRGYLITQFFSMVKAHFFMSGNNNLKYFFRILTSGIHYSIEKDKEEAFDYLMGVFSELSISISQIPQAFTDVKMYYAMIFNKIMSDKASKILTMTEIIFSNEISMLEDCNWIEFKFYCIEELKKLKNNSELIKNVEQYHIQTVLCAVDFRDKYHGYLCVPGFVDRIKENINSPDEVSRVVEDMMKILLRCIFRDNIPAFTLMLGEIYNCFDITTPSNKLAQKELFNSFLRLLRRTSTLINQQYLELTFEQIKETIVSLDKRKAVSSDFAATIIKGLANVIHLEKRSNGVIYEVVDLLYSFSAGDTAVSFIVTSSENKKLICRSLFNIGTDCIESNDEEGLRRVSNSLGWLAISSLKQGTGGLTKYILERAEELYQIASEMEVSQKTMTFLLTLFTTIGTYCCKDPLLYIYRDMIIRSLHGADAQNINTAIRLRTSENDMWNNLFENKTTELTSAFEKEYTKQTKIEES